MYLILSDYGFEGLKMHGEKNRIIEKEINITKEILGLGHENQIVKLYGK